MTDRRTDIPELHAALTAAAARAPRTVARRTRVLRMRAATALCVVAVGLVGVVGAASSASPGPSAPLVGSERPNAPAATPDLLRCVLASIPAALVPGTEVGPDGRSC